jgi:hypothetical protein
MFHREATSMMDSRLMSELLSENALRRRNTGRSWVELDCIAKGAGRRLEDGFADVVRVTAVVKDDVQVHPALGACRVPKIGNQFAVEFADLGRRHGDVPDPVSAASEVYGGRDQSLIHGQEGMPVTADAGPISKGSIDRLAKADSHILGRVVSVDTQVTRASDAQVDESVAGEQLEHVVEKADSRRDFG